MEPYEFVVAFAEGTVVDVYPVFVFGLVETAFDRNGRTCCLAVVKEEVLVVVRPLLQWLHDFVAVVDGIVCQSVILGEETVSKVAVEVYVATGNGWC